MIRGPVVISLLIVIAAGCRNPRTESGFATGDRSRSNAVCAEAETALRAGRFEDAVKSWQRAEQLDPSNPTPHADAGRYYWLKRQFKEAAGAYERASRRDPNNAGLLLDWIQALKDSGDYTRIEYLARRAAALAPDNPKALVYLGEHLAFFSGAEEARKEAIAVLSRAGELAPYMPLPHLALGRALLGAREYERADAELNAAWRLLHQGDRPLQQLDTMAHVERRRAEAAYAMAGLADAKGERAQAELWRRRFREVDRRIENRSKWGFAAYATPPDRAAVIKLAEMDLQIGGTAEAQALIANALRTYPKDPALRSLAAKIDSRP